MHQVKEVLQSYAQLFNCRTPKPFGDGHINDTYLVESPTGQFILQRVNNKIFNTPVLISNLSFLFDALDKYTKTTDKLLTPAVLKNKNGNFHTLDRQGAAWRLMTFYPGCRSYAISPNKDISYEAASAMGRFRLFLNTLPVNSFGETIKSFHNTSGRLETFLKILKTAPEELKTKTVAEIDFVEKHQDIAHELKQLLATGKVPVRITHNDTKLDNILFTPENGVLVIDLDTIMPGYVMFDYGDMVRTFVSPAKEDEPDISKPGLRPEHFETLTKGYLEPLKNVLSEVEKEHLLLGAKAIIYEQTLRFLADYLLGNVYYKTAYPEHNLIRTRTQIKLLDDILKQEDKLSEIIQQAL